MAYHKKKRMPDDCTLAAIAEVERVIEETRRNASRLFAERRAIELSGQPRQLVTEPTLCNTVRKWRINFSH